jgi:hypothetical protein
MVAVEINSKMISFLRRRRERKVYGVEPPVTT